MSYPKQLLGLAVLLAIVMLLGLNASQVSAQSGTRTPYIPPPVYQPRELSMTLVVRLPADATLEIEGAATKQQGEVRRFASPPLLIGNEYVYGLKATWTENGQPVVRERLINVRAGTEIVVDMRQAPAKKESKADKKEEKKEEK